ncbi:hypothetical protein MTR_7g023890 [Medicago truncatula]|uniref:Uncharacterized protein n=1 Tax=Medicago truncatula TaxID=3880 RepID=G7KWQ7_MEDTR|nr:hypothetical protein MTR_7g023890 [Medicago truncatula]
MSEYGEVVVVRNTPERIRRCESKMMSSEKRTLNEEEDHGDADGGRRWSDLRVQMMETVLIVRFEAENGG